MPDDQPIHSDDPEATPVVEEPPEGGKYQPKRSLLAPVALACGIAPYPLLGLSMIWSPATSMFFGGIGISIFGGLGFGFAAATRSDPLNQRDKLFVLIGAGLGVLSIFSGAIGMLLF